MYFGLLSCVDKNYQTLNKEGKKKSLSDLEAVRSLVFISFPSAGDAGQFWVLFIVRFTRQFSLQSERLSPLFLILQRGAAQGKRKNK